MSIATSPSLPDNSPNKYPWPRTEDPCSPSPSLSPYSSEGCKGRFSSVLDFWPVSPFRKRGKEDCRWWQGGRGIPRGAVARPGTSSAVGGVPPRTSAPPRSPWSGVASPSSARFSIISGEAARSTASRSCAAPSLTCPRCSPNRNTRTSDCWSWSWLSGCLVCWTAGWAGSEWREDCC